MKLERTENIFNVAAKKIHEELFEEILSNKHFKLERIVSEGQSSPTGFWYDQDKNEFVLLLSGAAKLIYDDGQTFNLKSGDYLMIPEHKKHRVEWTDPNQKTIWLALHY